MRAFRWVGLGLLLSLLGIGMRARAQTVLPPAPRMDRSFDVQLFHPAVGAYSFITLDSAEVLEHKLFNFGLVTSYERQPFSYTLSTLNGEGGTRVLKGHVEVAKVRIDVQAKDASKEATQERGEVVKNALVKNGIEPQRLKVAGLGPGPSRVEFIVEGRLKPRRSPLAIPVTPTPDNDACLATLGQSNWRGTLAWNRESR